MNSKLILFFTLLLTSCGVKSPPTKYPAQAVDSYIREYTHEDKTPDDTNAIIIQEEAVQD